MSLKKFESFMEDRERERAATREREKAIISEFSTEPVTDVIEPVNDTEVIEITPEDTLEVGKTIAEEFPVELVDEPQTVEFSTEQEINDQFPVATDIENQEQEETAPEHIEDDTNAVTIDGFNTY